MAKKNKKSFFERFANKVTTFTGSSVAFLGALGIVIIWAVTGPIFQYSETWQLVINTGTTIITFLMVFLIQKSQNKDSKAIQLKLNELIAANEKASNRMVDIEDLDEEELDDLHVFYEKLSDLAEKEYDIHESHSIDVAEQIHQQKKKGRSLAAEKREAADKDEAVAQKPAKEKASENPVDQKLTPKAKTQAKTKTASKAKSTTKTSAKKNAK
ncbi:MAG: low affinity iron permease family protein [Daejeonella sp.]